MEKISEIWKKWQIVTIGTGGNYSEKESEKYKKKVIDANRFASKFHIEDTEKDITKKNNKVKNDEEVVNDN